MARKQRPHHAPLQPRSIAAPVTRLASNAAAVEADVAAAIQHLRAGQFQHAQSILTRFLKAQPSHPVALHLLGVIALQAGRHKVAADLIGKAVALKPDIAEAHNNLGSALSAQAKLEEAVASYQKAIALRPNYAKAHSNLGVARTSQGKLHEAVACFRKSIALAPNVAQVHNNLGSALRSLDRLDEAVASYRQAIALKPTYAEAHSNLGYALIGQGKFADAVGACQRAVALQPNYAKTHHNLSVALIRLGRFADAADACRQAIALKPDFAEAHARLGDVLETQGKFEEAVASCRNAIAFRPDLAAAHASLGVALKHLCKFDEAVACFRKAIALEPAFATPHWDLGRALLFIGQFKEGWAEYEWRSGTKRSTGRKPSDSISEPLWDGSDLRGKTILLHTEQGLGDTIQFVRYVSIVGARGGRIVVECQKPLVRLLAGTADIDELVCYGNKLPTFDFHCPLLSLPYVLGTTLETIPAEVPYLKPDPEKLGTWRARFNGIKGLKVGLVWAGNPKNPHDRNRSIDLRTYAPLLTIEGVEFFSLQKGARTTDIVAYGWSDRISDLDPHIPDFSDTAAAVSLLDLVISVDTAIGHLTGALGKPIWTLHSFMPPWRWLLEREDSPWYPSMRLFRQKQRGDWGEVIARVRDDLTALARGDRSKLDPDQWTGPPATTMSGA